MAESAETVNSIRGQHVPTNVQFLVCSAFETGDSETHRAQTRSNWHRIIQDRSL